MSYLRPRAALSGITSQRRGPRVAMVALSDTDTGTLSVAPTVATATATTPPTAAPTAPANSTTPWLTYALYGGAAYLGYKLLFGKKATPAPSPA